MKPTNETNHAKDQAKAQLESIQELVGTLISAQLSDDKDAETSWEEAERAIQEDALCIEVRSDWHVPGEAIGVSPCEYKITLCTGGPACRIIGTLTAHGEPETARIEYQDWGTPWKDYRLTQAEEETVLHYARCFYFGEGD